MVGVVAVMAGATRPADDLFPATTVVRMPRLRIRLHDLPPPVPGVDVFAGVQIRRDVEQVTLLEEDPLELTAEFEIVAPERGDDRVDFRGPYVQGKRGDRFVYVSWGSSGDPEDFGMYRRAKVILDEIPAALLDGSDLVASIDGTSPDGGPVCARVRPESVAWTRDR